MGWNDVLTLLTAIGGAVYDVSDHMDDLQRDP